MADPVLNPNPLFGRSIGINVDRPILSDSTKELLETAVVYAGRPVAIDPTTGKLVDFGNDATTGGAGNVKPFGLARANKNQYANEARGSNGMYGSGQVDVAMLCVATLKSNVFSSTDGSDVEKQTYDADLEYFPGDELYVDQSSSATKRGLITKTKVETDTPDKNDNTFVGTVMRKPSATDKTMQIYRYSR